MFVNIDALPGSASSLTLDEALILQGLSKKLMPHVLFPPCPYLCAIFVPWSASLLSWPSLVLAIESHPILQDADQKTPLRCGVAQMVDRLSRKCEALSSNLQYCQKLPLLPTSLL